MEALDAQSSFEQRNFLAVAQYLGERVCGKADISSPNAKSADAAKPNALQPDAAEVKIYGGEGLDGRDTENTGLIAGCQPGPAVYLAELLGRYRRQKWVLVFFADSNASERLFVITLSATPPEDAISQLHKHGLAEATVIAEGHGARIYIWTQDHSQDARIHAFSEDNRGAIQELAGNGQLIGNDDRAKAQQVFDGKLAAYERQHHVAYSRQLKARRLRRMRE